MSRDAYAAPLAQANHPISHLAYPISSLIKREIRNRNKNSSVGRCLCREFVVRSNKFYITSEGVLSNCGFNFRGEIRRAYGTLICSGIQGVIVNAGSVPPSEKILDENIYNHSRGKFWS